MGFKVDAVLPQGIAEAAMAAQQYESLGFDGLYSTETTSDPFLDLASVATGTTRPLIGTNLAIAFARSPFVTAMNAWQLQKASKGRFVVGLGTQVKGHVERRFGMPWESPGPKLREYVQAMKMMFDHFAGNGPFDFQGKYYTHNVINPFFNPGPIDHPAPKIWIAAVNEYNAKTVGLCADGILVHPLHSRRYIDEVLMPAIDSGLAESGRTRADITVMVPVFVVAGDTDEERRPGADFVRSQISFYGSTRTYRRPLEMHGWGDVNTKLHELMKAGDFAGMSDQITDEMLDTYGIVCATDELGDRIRQRYDGVADRIYFYNLFASPFSDHGPKLASLVSSLQ